MHFDIIQISTHKIAKDDYITHSDICEDELYLSESDWGGDERTGDDVTYSLEGLKKAIKPFATVNVKGKTIRFHEPEVVKREWLKTVNANVEAFKKNLAEERYPTAEFELYDDSRKLGVDVLFCNYYCMTLSRVIAEYLGGYIPQTLHIGAILDAHR